MVEDLPLLLSILRAAARDREALIVAFNSRSHLPQAVPQSG